MRSTNYPPLTPITSIWMQDLLKDKEVLRSLFSQYGSPINVHNMGPFENNYKTYTAIFDDFDVNHNIFFARKANVCRAFVREAKLLGFGVDTASYRELSECLEIGCEVDKLILTASVKNEQLVRLALKNDVLIVLDNKDECRLVNRLAHDIGKTPTVAIRVSGFNFEGEKLYSRFGFDIEKARKLIVHQLGPDGKYENLQFGGFHFHLDGYSIEQRAAALLQTLRLTEKLKEKGITTSFIDMGGGLLTRYLSDSDEWRTFWDEIRKALKNERDPLSFDNHPLGLTIHKNEVTGKPNVYPYFNKTSKGQFLASVLSSKNRNGKTIASLFNEQEIELRIEPGRSLLDQTGVTLAKVAHRKKDQRGDWLVGLEMNRSQLFSSSDDFLVDPYYIPMKTSDSSLEPTAVYFTGSYCLEQDIILKRKIMLPKLPDIGDIIAFPNTAGYMMHFYETRSHLHPFTTNLIMEANSPYTFVQDHDI